MSNLRAEITSSAAEARSQAAISERIVKLQQKLAELQIHSQLYKVKLDAMEIVDQVVHFSQVFYINIIIAVLHNLLFQEHTLMLVMYHHPSSFNPVIIPVHQLVASLYLNLINFNLVIIPVRH